METDQILKVGAFASYQYTSWQFFFAKMTKDGRIYLPELTIKLLTGQKANLIGQIMEIILEPA